MDRHPEPEYMDDPAEAAAYAAADFAEVNAAFVTRLLELSREVDRPGLSAIDLGTGPGDIAIRVARARPKWSVVGVDASEPMLTVARQGAHEIANVSFCLRDAKATNLPARSFDVIFSNSLLHHLPDPQLLWREIMRLARPGAVVFIRDLLRPASAEAAHRIVQIYAGGESPLLQAEFYRSLLSAFTLEEIRRQLSGVGLAGLEIQRASDRHVDIAGRISASL